MGYQNHCRPERQRPKNMLPACPCKGRFDTLTVASAPPMDLDRLCLTLRVAVDHAHALLPLLVIGGSRHEIRCVAQAVPGGRPSAATTNHANGVPELLIFGPAHPSRCSIGSRSIPTHWRTRAPLGRGTRRPGSRCARRRASCCLWRSCRPSVGRRPLRRATLLLPEWAADRMDPDTAACHVVRR